MGLLWEFTLFSVWDVAPFFCRGWQWDRLLRAPGDAGYEERASVHGGKGSQDDFNDAKIWLEPEIEVARPGRTLKRHALGQALKVILDTFALGKWTINKTMRNFFNTMYRACVYTVDC